MDAERVGEALQPRPFARRHAPDAFAIDLSPDVRDGRVVRGAAVHDEIALPAHAADDDGVGDGVVGNVARAAQFEWERDVKKIDEGPDPDEWHMTPQTVNAYYHPLENVICFPAAILQLPFFSVERDMAQNFGAIGAVIGLIGGVKVYSKFSSGDPDTSKTAASWFGACIFLIVAATILRSFFL